MRASDAMLLGSLTETPKMGSFNCCALGLAANAVGIPKSKRVRLLGETWMIHQRLEAIPARWPWMAEACRCNMCALSHMLRGNPRTHLWHISDMFEYYNMSAADIAAYVRSIEPDCVKCNRFNCACVPETVVDQEVSEIVCTP